MCSQNLQAVALSGSQVQGEGPKDTVIIIAEGLLHGGLFLNPCAL